MKSNKDFALKNGRSQESHARNFKINLFEYESQLNNLPKNQFSMKNCWELCYKLSNLCLEHSLFLYKSNEISKAEVYILRSISYTDYNDNAKNWTSQLDFQKLRLEISHVFSMIFRHKHENFIAYENLKKIASTLDLSVFHTSLDKNLAGIDVFYKNLALFAYKLENYEEVIEISEFFIKEIREFLGNRKEIEKFRLKSFANTLNIYDDFILQKKIVLSYFYYLLAKSFEKTKKEDLAFENIKLAMEALSDKNHDFHKKYNHLYKQLMNRLSIKHSLTINYDDFKRNLQEEQAKNSVVLEVSFELSDKKVIKNPNKNNNKPLSSATSIRKLYSNPLKKLLMVSETWAHNKSFSDRQKLFNQSLNNCSTTVRKNSPSTFQNSVSRSILKTKTSSFHQKLNNTSSQKPTVKFPLDLKHLLTERPKSAISLGRKSKPKEKIKEPQGKTPFPEENIIKTKEKSIIKPKSTHEISEKQLPPVGPPITLRRVTQKLLNKAFSTKFNLLDKNKIPSKSQLSFKENRNNRRYSERPDIFLQKRPDPLRIPQSGHLRFSSVGVTHTISSSQKSPRVSSAGKRPSASLYSGSCDSSQEIEEKCIDEVHKSVNSQKDPRTFPVKLATISNVVSEESPANPINPLILESFDRTYHEIKEKVEFPVPFVRIIFAWLLLKKKKKKFQREMLQCLKQMPVGRFFGSEFEIVREKLLKITNGSHIAFWFFCKPPGNSNINFWKAVKVNIELKREYHQEEEVKDLTWSVKGIEIIIRIYLENSRSRGPLFLLEINEKIENLLDSLKTINDNRKDIYYNFIDIMLSQWILKWDPKDSDFNKNDINISSHDQTFQHKISQKLWHTSTLKEDLIDEPAAADINKEEKFKGFIKTGSYDANFGDKDINNIYQKLRYIIINLIKLKRKFNGFGWIFRKTPSLIQEEKNLESLIEKFKSYSRKEIYRKAVYCTPLKIFKPKEKKATGVLMVYKKNSYARESLRESGSYFHRNSLLMALQRNSQNALMTSSNQYLIKETKVSEEDKLKIEQQKKIINNSTIEDKDEIMNTQSLMKISTNNQPNVSENLIDNNKINEYENNSNLLPKIVSPFPLDRTYQSHKNFEENKNFIDSVILQDNLNEISEISDDKKENSEFSNKTENSQIEQKHEVIEEHFKVNLDIDEKHEISQKISEKSQTSFLKNKSKIDGLRQVKSIEQKKNSYSIFPEKPYNIEANLQGFLLNPFNEKDILLQGVFKLKEPHAKWKILTISIGIINFSQRVSQFRRKAEKKVLEKKMKDYFFNINICEIYNCRKIIDFSSFSYEQLVSELILIKKSEEKLFLFKKMNLLGKFPHLYEKKLLYKIQNQQKNEVNPNFSHLPEKLRKIENTLKNTFHYSAFGKKQLFYLKGTHLGVKKTFRIQKNPLDSLSLILSCYEPMGQKTDYCLIKNKKDLEKLKNMLKLKNKNFQWKIFLLNVSFERGIIGKKLYFNWKHSESLKVSTFNSKTYNPADILAGSQHPFLKHHYRYQIYYELYQIKTIGKCYIKIRIYFPLSEEIPKEFIKLKFDFFPLNKRVKILKLALSYGDILKHFINQLQFHNTRALLNELNRGFFHKIIIFKENCHDQLALKTSDQDDLDCFRMNFSEKNEISSLLRRENLKYRCVFQVIKKIQGFYTVITIKQNLYLNLWTALFYFPHSHRTFSCTIYQYELLNLSKEFWKNFLQSSSKSTIFDSSQKNNIDSQNLPNIDDLIGLFSKNYMETKSGFLEISKGIKPGNLLSYIAKKTNFLFNLGKISKENLKINNLEILFWDEFMNFSSVMAREKEKLVLVADKYLGVIREIYKEKLVKKETNTIFYQMHYEEKPMKNKIGYFGHFSRLNYEKPVHLKFYIRVIDIESLQRRNYCFQGSNFKGGFDQINKEFELDSEIFLKNIKIYENAAFSKQGLEGWSRGDRIFLYKGVLLPKTKHLISLVYLKSCNEIQIRIYDQRKGGKEIKKKILPNALEGMFPNYIVFLKVGAYRILGNILFKLLKNTLILYIFRTNYIKKT